MRGRTEVCGYRTASIKGAGGALLRITGHEHLAGVTGLHPHGFVERGLVASKISTTGSCVGAATGKAVIETTFAGIVEATVVAALTWTGVAVKATTWTITITAKIATILIAICAR